MLLKNIIIIMLFVYMCSYYFNGNHKAKKRKNEKTWIIQLFFNSVEKSKKKDHSYYKERKNFYSKNCFLPSKHLQIIGKRI